MADINQLQVPKISFIYCNYSAARLLEQALLSVMEAAVSIPYEIIIVDDMSNDNSVEMIRTKFPSVHLIVNTETLWSEPSFNKAIQASKGTFIYFLGTDTIVHKGTAEALLSFMDRNPDVRAVTCRVFLPDGRFQQNACRDHNLKLALLNFTFLGHLFPSWKRKFHDDFTYKGWNWDENHEVEASGFTNLLIRRSALETAGFIDTGFRQYFSENDLCLRIRKNGGKIYYLAVGKVIHHLRGTVSKSNIKQIAKNYEQDCFHYFHKYYGLGAAVLLQILISFSNLILSIRDGKFNRVFTRFLASPEQAKKPEKLS